MRKLPVLALLAIVTLCVGIASPVDAKRKKDKNAAASCKAGKMVTTNTGLQYEDKVVGKGAQPKSGQEVTVHYTGWLTNGSKFDSSVDRREPFKFHLGQSEVIKGWDEGVATMRVGGKRRLTVPAQLGYGAAGAGGQIPPNSTLIFDVELLSVQ